MRYLEIDIPKTAFVDYLYMLYVTGKIAEVEHITNLEISCSFKDKTVGLYLQIEKELEVKLIEHHGKRLYEGSSVGGQTGTGETP